MAHYFEIKTNKAGEFVAYFKYNSESIFWTEGYKSKASAKNAIESILKNARKNDVTPPSEFSRKFWLLRNSLSPRL